MIEGYRLMPPWRKMQLVTGAYGFARQLHAAGVRLRNPTATVADVNRDWALVTLGPGPWLDRLEFGAMSQPADHVRPLKYAISILDDLGIRYAIGGSLASSTHGVPRFTQAADLIVEPFAGKEGLFGQWFPEEEYYADERMIRNAVVRRSSFNVLHLPTSFKIDFFVRKDRPFDREVLARRIEAQVFGEGEGLFGGVTAEDVILLKLEWYRLGGESSERQWNDILGVLRTRGEELDGAYLDRWAVALGVQDLLERARQ